MLKKIESLIFTSDKYNEAISFFEEKLGFGKKSQTPEIARFELKGFPIFVARAEKGDRAFVTIETDNIESDYKLLCDQGIEVTESINALEGGDKAAFFKGLAGIEFMLYQPAVPDDDQIAS